VRKSIVIVGFVMAAGSQAGAAWAQGKLADFDGSWTVRVEASSQCPERLGPFGITIRAGSVSAPGGAGSVGINGAISFTASGYSFSGRLTGRSGSGSISGRCHGNWSASR